MSYNIERDLSDCCINIESSKASERKKRFEQLGQYLQDTAYKCHLNDNFTTKSKNNAVQWNQLFLAAHRSLMKEMSDVVEGQERKAFSMKQGISIVSDLANKANTDNVRLNCREVISCLLEALESQYNRNYFVPGYINILLNAILCHKQNSGDITLLQWIDLLNICLVVMEETNSERIKCSVTSCLNYICLYGSYYNGFLINMQNILKLLPELVKQIASSNTFLLQANVIQLTLTICQQMKKEFRFSICKFSEAAFPYIIRMYESKDVFKRKDLLAKLLTEIVEAHHPCGVPAKSPGSLAFSWDSWNENLRTLYRCLEDELDNMIQSKNICTNPSLQLAVVVAKQVFSETSRKQFSSQESIDYSFVSSPPMCKRRKLDAGIDSIISIIQSKMNISDIWPLLVFLEELMFKHPELFTDDQFMLLLEFTAERLPTCNIIHVTKYLCKISIQLRQLENILEEQLKDHSKESQRLWGLIWSSAMSSLQFSKQIGMKQPIEEIHLLVQTLLKTGFHSTMVEPLLNLYVSNMLPFSTESLKTFLCLCQNTVISETIHLRITLLEWLIKNRVQDECSLAVLSAQVAFALMLKSKLPQETESESTPPPKWNDTELYFIATALETPPCLTKKTCHTDKPMGNIIENAACCAEVINLLKEKEEEHEVMTDFLVILTHSTFLYVLASLADYYKFNCTPELKLFLNNSLNSLWPILLRELEDGREEVLNELLVASNILFNEVLKTPEYVSDKSVEKMAQHLFVFFIQQYKSSKVMGQVTISQKFANDDFDDQQKVNFDEISSVQLNTLKLILKFAELNSICHENDCIEEYLFVVCTDSLELNTRKGFKLAIFALKTILKRKKVSNDVMGGALNLIRELFKIWFKYHDELLIILQTLSDCVKHVYSCTDQDHHNNLCDLIGTCTKYIFLKKKYGPSILSFLVEVMVTMIKIDVSYKWKVKFGENEIKLPTALHFLEFFKSSFNEVRFKAIEYIPLTFKNERASDDLLEIQSEAFSRLVETVADMFTVRESLAAEDVEEEAMKRSCSALKVLITLTTNSSFWRRKALSALFKLISSKNISNDLVNRVLKQIEMNMKLTNVTTFLEQNLDYISLNWYKEFKHFKDFPFGILNCSSRRGFYIEYKKKLVPIILENGDLEVFSQVCLETGISEADLAKQCYPEIMSCLLPKFTPNPLPTTLAMFALLKKIMGNSSFEKLLTSEFEKVLICIYERLHNETHFNKLCGEGHSVTFPTMTSSHISFADVTIALSYLQKTSSDPEKPLLVLLCLDHSYHIHSIMHSLLTKISEASCDEIRALSFHQYIALCDEFIINVSDIGDMRGYVIRSVIHVLINLSNSELAIPALNFMYRVVTLSLPQSATVIDDLLPHVIPVLISFVKNDIYKEEAAMKVLELIMVENRVLLKAVDDLDPVPDDPKFSLLKKYDGEEKSKRNLKDEIQNFLNAGVHTLDPSFRAEGLEHLNEQLIKRKHELAEFYEEMKLSRGFSEHCNNSVLHQLIISLVQLTTCNNMEISQSAARCLGEIGPCDLTTLVLKPQPCDKPPSLASVVLKHLIPLMVHNNPKLSLNVVLVLQALLQTKEGHDAKETLTNVEKSYLTPFISVSRKHKTSYSTTMTVDQLQESMEFWCPYDKYIGYNDWIINLTSALLSSYSQENSFIRLLIPIVESQVNIAEYLLPYLTYMVLKHEEGFTRILEEKINSFFKNHFNLQQENSKEENKHQQIYSNRASVQSMLSVINFYRQREITSDAKLKRPLELNYLHIAQAAQFCKAYFTSVLYAELWTEQMLSSLEAAPSSIDVPPMEIISQNKPEEAIILQNLLWEAYKEIGEVDAVYGCGEAHLIERCGRIKYYSQMGMWQKVIEECELAQDTKYNEDLINALRMSGKYTIAMQISAETSEYECAWRLNNWSFDLPKEDSYSGFLYGALKAFKNKDTVTACQLVYNARKLVIDSLAHASLEVANSIYQPLSKLRSLRELEVLGCEKAEMRWLDESGRWIDFEPIYYQRGLLIESEGLPEIWLHMAEKSNKYNCFLVAQRCLDNAEQLKPIKKISDKIYLKQAQLAWKTGDSHKARHLLKRLLDENNKTPTSVLSEALLTYGTWMAESKSEQPCVIIQKYFEKADIISEYNQKDRFTSADCLARYADAEFKRLKEYRNSVEYTIKQENNDVSIQKLAQLELDLKKNKGEISSDHLKAIKTYQVQIEMDKEKTKSLHKNLNAYLQLAVSKYIDCLILGNGDSNDLKMFRLVSLWLSNSSYRNLQELMDDSLQKIPSYKFLVVLPQLAVRVSDEKTPFSKTLNSLLIRCCREHPHHSLPLILALANSHKDNDFLYPSSNKKTLKKHIEEEVKPRVKGSILIRDNLIKDKSIGEMVTKLQMLSLAYISLANCEIAKNTLPGDYNIPSVEPIRKIKNLSNVSCLSLTQPVIKSGNYTKIIGIQSFEETLTLVGGINQPKKVKCVCTDGLKRDQLVKGKDDLRQDAVMQQVFTVMNILLRNEENTAKRKLLIRTYKVVPLSQRSGLIEWVKNTEPIGNYLTGTKTFPGAHKRYRPKDLNFAECRNKLMEVANKKPEEKLKMYNYLCTKFKPVFRHFFTEKYTTPGVWFERRLAYTRSVATNSMIGYILGIGDRHVANILIDQITAEVVHIDFGIAFEQGLLLPTPETVPFRLTRDIVDGMGVTGVEGVFRRCCEETMSVLRKCQEPILTTVEVLLYDPLYTWSVTPKMAQKRQLDNDSNQTSLESGLEEESSADTNTLAMRALQRLKHKLQGCEEGSTTGVEGQVSLLINTAKDPANLCAVFRGWQPYL